MEKVAIIVNRKDSPGMILENFMNKMKEIGISSKVIESGQDTVEVEFFVEVEKL